MEERLEKIPTTPVPTKDEFDKDYSGKVKPEIAREQDRKIQDRIHEQLMEFEVSVLDDNPPLPNSRAD